MNQKYITRVFQVIFYLLGGLILFLLVRKVGLSKLTYIFLHTSWEWILGAIFIYAISWLLRTWRLWTLLESLGHRLKFLEIAKIHIAGFALNAVFPAKIGDIASIGFLKAQRVAFGKGAAVILQTRILDILTVLLLIIPSGLVVLPSQEELWMARSGLIVFGLILIPLSIMLLDRGQRIPRLLERLEQGIGHAILKFTIAKIKDTYQAYHRIAFDKSLLFNTTMMSLSLWILESFTCYCIAVAVGLPLMFWAIVLALGLANMAKSVPITPGGVGIYESTLALILSWQGYPLETAIVIGLLDHFLKKLFNVLIGWPALYSLGMDSRDILTLLTKIRKTHKI